jgi:hypothetical protein
MTNQLPLGSVSHGTMREEDLIPAFISFLRQYGPPDIQGNLGEVEERMAADDYFTSDAACYDLNEDLFNFMNDVAPEGYYFGSHPGDGSDYGFWPNEDLE